LLVRRDEIPDAPADAAGRRGSSPTASTAPPRYFPLVGQLVGLLCAGAWLTAGRLWPGLPAAVLAVAVGVLVTGRPARDGLADTADGLAAA